MTSIKAQFNLQGEKQANKIENNIRNQKKRG